MSRPNKGRASMAFETVIKKVRFEFVGYSGEQMTTVSNAMITKAILPRIQSGAKIDGSPAQGLTNRYARLKARKHPPALRNWSFTGQTLRSMKTITAKPNQAVVGFTTNAANMRAGINNARARQFGVGQRESIVVSEEFGKLGPFVSAR